MLKKLIAMLLVLLMVVPMLASCGGDKPEETEAQTKKEPGAVLESDDPLIPEINEYVDELSAQHKFKGETFTWIGPNGFMAPDDERETGDVKSDAMYYRQRDIEDLFGVDWVNYTPEALGDGGAGLSPAIEAIKQDVLAGTGAYNAAYGFTMHTQVLLVNDALLNMSDFTTMDLERPWWPAGLEEMYNINGSMYMVTGPIVPAYYQDTMSVVFNKQVAEDYGVENLYDIVKAGDWTFDKMIEVASKIPSNDNGSGAYRYADADGMSILVAHGVNIMKFDENGAPYVEDNLSTEISNIADKFSVIFSDDTQSVNQKGYGSSSHEDFSEKYGYENYPEMFEDDRILFLFIPTDEAAYLRQRDVNFGILPMPKGSTAQDNYISYATSRSLFNVFIPKSVKNVEMTDVVVEAMAALGYKYFKTAFYETLLKGRSTKDFDSKDMIDIIFSTKKYDLINVLDKDASVNGDGVLVSLLDDCVVQSTDNFASRFFINSKIVNGNLKMILAKLAADQ